MNNRQILEALRMQPLTEEEKSARHILGRLYGPIATCNSSTRNGRRYNKDLWEKALSDDLFKEKIDNKSLFLELGHPIGREETDMEKVCACIPEMPKIVNGDLYAYVDILDTPNGKLLKTFCDYGFTPGISSRGSGDIMENNEVDPDTFFLETWDIVQLPAVKDARLSMCESIDTKAMQLKKVLTESFAKASDRDKKVMQEALDNLDIELDEDADFIVFADGSKLAVADIPQAKSVDEPLMEDAEDSAEDVAEEEPIETVDEENNVNNEELIDFIKELGMAIANPEVSDEDVDNLINDKLEQGVGDLEFWKGLSDSLTEIIGYSQEIGDNIEEVEDKAEPAEVELDAEEEPEEAEDNGDEEVIESLKEMVREKDLLEKECKSLKDEKAVSDAEVENLKEELSKYKDAFIRTSAVAAKTKTLANKIEQLNEQLAKKDGEITSLKKSQQIKLTESANKTAREVKQLKESLIAARTELDETNQKLTEQANVYKKKLNENAKIAKQYKEQYNSVLTEFINYRASMLGIRPADITNRLEEGFTIADINKVCDSILERGAQPFGFNKTSKVVINESKDPVKRGPQYGYEIDDSLLELAGLK